TYEDFDSRVIEVSAQTLVSSSPCGSVKSVFNMTAKEGRKRSISCLVAVGNGNGAAVLVRDTLISDIRCRSDMQQRDSVSRPVSANAFWVMSSAVSQRTYVIAPVMLDRLNPKPRLVDLHRSAVVSVYLRRSVCFLFRMQAKNRAIHYLYYIERYNNHTIYHDIESTFKRTTLRMKKQNKGYGLRCHRAVITICRLIGIEDMYAKVEGSVNLLNITRALFQGLAKQASETHQSLADKKQLNVVEYRDEQGPLPIVVARPQLGAKTEPELEDEVPNTRLHWADVQAAQGMKRSPAQCQRWTENHQSTNQNYPANSVLWAASCGQRPVGSVLWAASCGSLLCPLVKD
ncbi:hypothetical protein NFI96_023176, partial [Prochilodus magdalenae]